MSQRVKRPNRSEDGSVPAKRRKRTTAEEEEAASLAAAAWQPRPNDMKSIYNRTTTEAPAELFRKDLISAMKLPDSEPLASHEYWLLTDQWKQEWERGVQVPVNPDSLPEPSVTITPFATKPHREFKLPKNKYIRITKDDNFKAEEHALSNAPAQAEAACSYDLDDVDVAWLKTVNGERARMGLGSISEDQLERIIEQFELTCWEKIQCILKNEECLGIEFDENVICDVCRSPDSEEGNEMVFCDSCNICVHQACYGITRIPAGQWLCGICTIGKRPECVLCPNKGGAMKSTRSGQKWAHVSCALWIPEVSIGCVERMEPITKVSSIPASRWALICVLCRERVGACIQCSVKTCKTAYHVTCAFKHGLEMRAIIEDENADDGVKLRSYCEKHSKAGKKEKSIYSGSDDEGTDNSRKRKRRIVEGRGRGKDMTSEEKNQARALRLQEIEAEFHKHVSVKDLGLHVEVDNDALHFIYNYWKLKRRAGHNKPLLAPKSEDADLASQKRKQADDAKMKMFVQLRQDLERVRNLCYMVSRREKLIRSYCKLRETVFYQQVKVLKKCPELPNSVVHSVVEANHGPSIYDRLYSFNDAPDHGVDEFDAMRSRIAGFSGDEKTPEPNGLLKDKNPYKKLYFNGSSKRRSGSMYGSGLSSASSSDETKHKENRNNSTTDEEKPTTKKVRKNNNKTPSTKRKQCARLDSTSEEDGKPLAKKDWSQFSRSRLKQVERELGISASDSDDALIPMNRSKASEQKMSSIYSDSDDSSDTKAEQQKLRTKAAMKEYKPSTSKNKSTSSQEKKPTLKTKKSKESPSKKKDYVPSDLIVPQRQAAKKATENLKTTKAAVPKEHIPEEPTSPIKIEEKPTKQPVPKPKPKTKEIKEPSSKKAADVFDIDKDIENQEILAYVPQRQAAKKAAEHIKSGLGKPVAGAVTDQPSPVECEKTKETSIKPKPAEKSPAKVLESKRKSSSNSSSSSSSSSSSDSSCSSSSSSENEDEKSPAPQQQEPQTRSEGLSSPREAPKRTNAKDWPFLDKGSKSAAASSSSSSDSSDSDDIPTPPKRPPSIPAAKAEVAKKVPVSRRKSGDKKQPSPQKPKSTPHLPSSSREKQSTTTSSQREESVARRKSKSSGTGAPRARPKQSPSASKSGDRVGSSDVRSRDLSERADVERERTKPRNRSNKSNETVVEREKLQSSVRKGDKKLSDSLEREILERKRQQSTSSKSKSTLDRLFGSPEKEQKDQKEQTPAKRSPSKSPYKSPSKSPYKSPSKSPTKTSKPEKSPIKEAKFSKKSPIKVHVENERDPQEQPSNVIDITGDDEEKEKMYENQLDEFDKQPNRFERQPSEFKKQPGEFERQSGEFERQSGKFERQSGEFERQSGEFERQSAEFEKQPDEFEKQPDEFKKQPVEFEKQHDEFEKQSGEFEKQSGELEKQSGEFEKQSGEFEKQPGEFEKQPGEFEKHPNEFEKQGTFNRSIFSPAHVKDFDFDNLDDGFGMSKEEEIMKGPLTFNFGNTTLFKEDSKEDSARETLNLVEKLRQELSKKTSGDVDDGASVTSSSTKNDATEFGEQIVPNHVADEPSAAPKMMNLEMRVELSETKGFEQNQREQDYRYLSCEADVPLEPNKNIPIHHHSSLTDHSMIAQGDERWVPPSESYPNMQPVLDPANFVQNQHFLQQYSHHKATPHMDLRIHEDKLHSPDDRRISQTPLLDPASMDCMPSPSPYNDMHPQAKWADSEVMPNRRSSSSSAASTSSSCSRRNDEDDKLRPDVMVVNHPTLENIGYLPPQGLPFQPNTLDAFQAYSDPSQFPVSLFPPPALNTQLPFPSPGPAMFPPAFAASFPTPVMPPLPKPVDDQTIQYSSPCTAAFTSSQHNMALTAAMVNMPPKELESPHDEEPVVHPESVSQTDSIPSQEQELIHNDPPVHLELNEPVRAEPIPEPVIQEPVPPPVLSSPSPSVKSNSSAGKKSPSKPTRTSARVTSQLKSPSKSPGKSPRQEAKPAGRGRNGDGRRNSTKSARGNVRGRGRGRGRGRSSLHEDTIHNKLVGTVYDLDFDDDISNDNMTDLKSMRERRRSVDIHEKKDSSQSPKFTSPHKRTYNTDILRPPTPVEEPIKGTNENAQMFPDIVQPVLPGPVDMRTYSNSYNEHQQTYNETNLLKAFDAGTTEARVHEDIDEDFEKELHSALTAKQPAIEEPQVPAEMNNIKVSLSDSRNQLKVKIKGPIANYSSSIPPLPPPSVETVVNAVVNNSAIASSVIPSGTSNLRRMRKKELLRQYWTQDMNMDDTICAPVPAPSVPPVSRTIITIPKAVASMTSIPTKDDYRDYRTGSDDIDTKHKREPKSKPGALSRELRQLDLTVDEDGVIERRRGSVGSNNSSLDISNPGKRRGRPPRPPATPKIKIKIGNNSIVGPKVDDKKDRIRPPKKRITSINMPSVEDLKRESMKFRKLVMADFGEDDKKKRKRDKKRKKSKPKVQIISNEAQNPTKLIIRIGKKVEGDGGNCGSSSGEQRTSGKTNSANKDGEPPSIKPIKLKLSRCQEGSGYIMKSSASVGTKAAVEEVGQPPPPPPPSSLQPRVSDSVVAPPPLPLNKDCEVR